jgi:hypothetical protein
MHTKKMLAASEDPFAELLAKARASAKAAETSWLGSQYASEDGIGMASPATRWNEVVRLLEALTVAARVSRALHKDCVTLPSQDVTHYYNVVTLHELLMQQLLSLETGLAVRQERASAVPARPHVAPMAAPLVHIMSPAELALDRARRAAIPQLPNQDWTTTPPPQVEAKDEEEGGSCIIA